MNRPFKIAQFSPPSKSGCWHFSSDGDDNLTISWLEQTPKDKIEDENKNEAVAEFE